MKTREKRRQSGIGKDGNNSGDLKGPKRMRWGRKTRKETVERYRRSCENIKGRR